MITHSCEKCPQATVRNVTCDECGVSMAEHSGEASCCGPANGYIARPDEVQDVRATVGWRTVRPANGAAKDVVPNPRAFRDMYPEPWETAGNGTDHWDDDVRASNAILLDPETVCMAHNAMADRLAEVEALLKKTQEALREVYSLGQDLFAICKGEYDHTSEEWSVLEITHGDAISKAREAVG